MGWDLVEVLREPSAAFQYADSTFGWLKNEWPPYNYIDGLALAQHYGLPTRLLDWTRDVFIAAYFAASHAIDQRVKDCPAPIEPNQDDRLAVWVFVESFAKHIGGGIPPLLMPMPPYHGNPNLAAQRGIFTLWRRNDGSQICDTRPLPEQVHYWLSRYRAELANEKIFTRVEMPARQAPQLLRLLMNRGYDASRLFPGYGGAAKAVEEKGRTDELMAGDAGTAQQ